MGSGILFSQLAHYCLLIPLITRLAPVAALSCLMSHLRAIQPRVAGGQRSSGPAALFCLKSVRTTAIGGRHSRGRRRAFRGL